MSSKSHTDGGHTIIATLRADGITTEIKGTPNLPSKIEGTHKREGCFFQFKYHPLTPLPFLGEHKIFFTATN